MAVAAAVPRLVPRLPVVVAVVAGEAADITEDARAAKAARAVRVARTRRPSLVVELLQLPPRRLPRPLLHLLQRKRLPLLRQLWPTLVPVPVRARLP